MKIVLFLVFLLLPLKTQKKHLNIYMVGDSITLSYTYFLREQLPGFTIRHPPVNCKNTTFTLENLDQWKTDLASADLVIWNNGIWDATLTQEPDIDKRFFNTPIEDYEKNLILIAGKLKSSGAKRVVFVTTSHIKAGKKFDSEKAERQNEIARALLPKLGVEVIEVFSPVQHHIDEVHYNSDGYEIMAKDIILKLGIAD